MQLLLDDGMLCFLEGCAGQASIHRPDIFPNKCVIETITLVAATVLKEVLSSVCKFCDDFETDFFIDV
jgi:hypothetical protein